MGLLSSLWKGVKSIASAPLDLVKSAVSVPSELIKGVSGAVTPIASQLTGMLGKALPIAASMAPMLAGLPPIPGLGGLLQGAGTDPAAFLSQQIPGMAQKLMGGSAVNPMQIAQALGGAGLRIPGLGG